MSDAAEDMDLGGEAPAEGGVPPAGQSPDVFADVPADGGLPEAEPAPPGGGLGGDGGTLEELEEEPLAEEAPINGGGDEEPVAPEPEPEPAPTPAEEPPAEPEPEPAAEPKAAAKAEPKAEPKKGGGKKGTTERVYHVLQGTEEGAFVIPDAVKDGIKATNGDGAMRAAYSALVDEDSDAPLTLVVIPAHYWKPKTVQSKVKRDRAIEIV